GSCSTTKLILLSLPSLFHTLAKGRRCSFASLSLSLLSESSSFLHPSSLSALTPSSFSPIQGSTTHTPLGNHSFSRTHLRPSFHLARSKRRSRFSLEVHI
ncbi:hypothetical protein F5H01DRAFT_297053, partial [Linnemannia elongata]